MILANGCNITKSEKFKGVWILSVPTVCIYIYIYIYIGLSKDPVLRYQVGTKKMKTSRYQVSLSPGGTEDPVDPVLAARSESCRCALFIKVLRRADIKRRKCIKLIKHFKDRHPDQMKEFKQVSFYLIFRYSVMNIIPYLIWMSD